MQMRLPIKSSIVTAAAIAFIAAAWILSGQIGREEPLKPPSVHSAEIASEDQEAPSEVAAPPNASRAPATAGNANELTLVRVKTLSAQRHVADLVLRGRTEAIRKVEVKSETSGTVAAVPVEQGSAVKEGDVLCELNVETRQAMLNQAKARMEEAFIKYEASRKLAQKGNRSETAMATDLASYKSAKAEAERMERELARTKLRAPFDGIVDRRLVEIGDYMTIGSPCAVVMDEEPFLVIGQVSENDVSLLSIGDAGEARLITGVTVGGKIRFIAKSADPATRTFRVELEVPNPERKLRDGMTAEIRVSTKTVTAHRLSPAILSLDDDGKIGVRIVVDGVVAFSRVEIVSSGPDGMWVTGLPHTVTVITVGQDFVREGERVNAVAEEEQLAKPQS